jgi:electron transport complex protein RnfB
VPLSTPAEFADAIDRALPQTQCTRCGYPDCRAYAEAIASGAAEINQCPPGGDEGIHRLAALTGRLPLALNPANGRETPRQVARIEEEHCIGCTLCIKACPVDCIVGAPKLMHDIVAAQCTGCELCLPACPVDCIVLLPASGERTGWAAWSTVQADAARSRHEARKRRLAQESATASPAPPPPAEGSLLATALARARARRAA